MSTHTNENDPAFPGPYKAEPGLTAREHAAIHLRVPMSGNPWLDAMITEARRWDAAQATLGILCGTEWPDEKIVGWAESAANALTRQMKGGAQ